MMSSPKKKVLHLIQSLGSGGCENMLLRTLPLIPDFQHTVLTLKEPGELAPGFAAKGIDVQTIHLRNLFSLSGILRLRRIVREQNPDIIITYLFHADVLGRLALFGATHAPVIPFLRTTYNHPRYRIARLFEWLTAPLVRRYLANSEAVKSFYIRHIGVTPERITVIPNGIDTEYFDRLVPDQKLRDSLSIGPDDFVIICVANLHPNKGHRFLLEAFEAVWPEFPQIKLLLVGDGEERGNIESMISSFRSKGAIRILGRRDDVPALLKLSRLFVLPTLFEGQSNAILEAMAAGVPVITTNIPENRVFINDGETGILVETESSVAIVNALKKFLSEPSLLERAGAQVGHAVKESHSLTSVAKSWNDFLRSL